ncbi:hypothetical protein ACFWPU_42275 [Streptomyces sp. NPDC058471]|uniref:hypothetical protein n=1 Tax=Streptomyces sp. NPDC058471 TaxID=3346516 RepID=UPI0036695682
MKNKIVTAIVLATLTLGAAPAAHAVDPVQEHNIANCYFDTSKTGKEKEKYCKALEGSPMTETAKNCLLRAGVGSAAALIVGKVNKKAAKEIAVNTVGAGATACLSSLIN